MDEQVKTANRRLIRQLLIVTVAMFGFGWLLVPLYSVFCELTGFGGKTGGQVEAAVLAPDTDRLVTVQFIASVAADGAWEFGPNVRTMQVHPGQLYTTTYFARNLRDAAAAGQAVPSVAPMAAAKYFQKTECFCFTRQEFGASEYKDMPVTFMLDPALPAEVDTVTLGYTYFDAKG